MSPPKLKSCLREVRLNSQEGLQELIFQSNSTLMMAAVMAEATKLQAPYPRKAIGIAMRVPAKAAAMFRMAKALKFISFCSFVICTMAKDWMIKTMPCTRSMGCRIGSS